MKLFYKWLICFGALLITWALFPTYIQVTGSIFALAAGAAVLWLLNLLVKPLLQIVCLPVTLLTVGLFFFVANAWMVSLMDAILPILKFNGFWICLFTALLVSIGNALLLTVRRARS